MSGRLEGLRAIVEKRYPRLARRLYWAGGLGALLAPVLLGGLEHLVDEGVLERGVGSANALSIAGVVAMMAAMWLPFAGGSRPAGPAWATRSRPGPRA